MRILILLLLNGLLVAPSMAPPSVESPCGPSFSDVVGQRGGIVGRSGVTSGERPLTLEQVTAGKWYLHEEFGLIYVDAVDVAAGAIKFRRKLQSPQSTGSNQRSAYFATPGTKPAEELTARRAEKQFRKPENVPLLFAFDVLFNRSEAKGGPQGLGRKSTLRDRYAKYLHDIDPSLDYEKLMHDMAHNFRNQEANPHYIEIVRKLARKILDETGEDIVRTGVLNSMERDGVFKWPAIGRFNDHSFIKLIGGKIYDIPADIDEFYRNFLWDQGINLLSVDRSPITTDEGHFCAIGSYRSGEVKDDFSQAILDFKAKPDPVTAQSFIDKGGTRLRTFADGIRKSSHGGPIVVVPVPPSKTREGSAPTHVLARKLAQNYGWTLDTESIRRTREAETQTDQSGLFSRIENAANGYEVSQDVHGKTVVLVDDVSTTRATIESLKRLAYENGANQVFVIVLGQTERW